MPAPLHIDLDIRVDGDEVEGSASRDGQATHFCGWIELLAALDELISGAQT